MVICTALMLAFQMAAAYEDLQQDHLLLHVMPAQRRIELYYHDQLLATNVAEFEVYRYSLEGGGRTRLLAGPFVTDAKVKADKSALVIEGKTADGELRYTLSLRLDSPDRLQVNLQIAIPKRADVLGLEVDLAKVVGDLFKGHRLERLDTTPVTTLNMPVTPLPESQRNLIDGAKSLRIETPSARLDMAGLNADSHLSATDLRAVSWDNSKTFMFYDRKRLLVPGSNVDLAYELRFRPPSSETVPQHVNAVESQDPPVAKPLAINDSYPIDHSLSPRVGIRAQLTELLPPAKKDMPLFKRYIDALAIWGANTLVLYHMPEHVDQLRTDRVAGNWWTKTELQEVSRYAGARGLTIIPGMSSKFTGPRFKDLLPRNGHSNFYCVDEERAYTRLFELYKTLLDLYQASALLVGHDEIQELQPCKSKSTEAGALLARDIERIHAWLQQRHAKLLMWGDMLLDSEVWEAAVGSAHGNSPELRSGATHTAIGTLPKDITILDWHYALHDDYPSLGYFKKMGFEVWGVHWYNPRAAIAMEESVERYHGDGILGTDWGFWSSFSPAATSLLGIGSAWNKPGSVRSQIEASVVTLASQLRAPLVSGSFEPVSLAMAVNEHRTDSAAYDGKGLFDLGPHFDLRALPDGVSQWGGVKFEILPDKADQNGIAVVYAAPNDRAHPNAIDIPLNGNRARALAFLHAMYRRSPSVRPASVGTYEVRYEDGQHLDIDLLENINITDFRLSPGLRNNPWAFTNGIDELLGAVPGWRGKSGNGAPLTTQILVWSNPFPGKPIAAIRMRAVGVDKSCKIALLGLSAIQL